MLFTFVQKENKMAVEKGLVLTAIEAKLKGKSASKNFKENIAAKWAEKIENEEGIQSFIDDREDVLIEACSEADRRAVSAVKAATEKKEEKTEKKEETKKEDENPLNALLEEFKSLKTEITTLKQEKQAESLQSKFLNHKDIKGINLPASVKEKYVPSSDEDFDSAVESFTSDFKPLVEADALSAYGNDKPTGSTDRKPAAETKKLSPEQAKKVVESM